MEQSGEFDGYENVSDLLIKEHFLTNAQVNNVLEVNDESIVVPDQDLLSNRELKYSSDSIRNNKAPGFDYIDGRVVKNLVRNYKSMTRILLNKCLNYGYFPEIWKKALVIYFKKQNKDPVQIKTYRPISLLPTMAKLLEKIIRNKVMINLESTNYLDIDQYGFRENRGVITALSTLLKRIDYFSENYKYCSMISFDIMGAFDNVSWDILYRVIEDTPLPNYLKRILKSYLNNRMIGTHLSDQIKWYVLSKGCPQESCIGPLLWLLVADKILKIFKSKDNSHNQSIVSYADDFVILAYGNTRIQLEENANMKIRVLVVNII